MAEVGADGSSFTGSRRLTKTGLALQSIAAQADEKRPSRVLLFTDGYSTEPLQEAAAQMEARGIPLDFRLIREETENDFRIARIGFPRAGSGGRAIPHFHRRERRFGRDISAGPAAQRPDAH